jgi:hypothetical protein
MGQSHTSTGRALCLLPLGLRAQLAFQLLASSTRSLAIGGRAPFHRPDLTFSFSVIAGPGLVDRYKQSERALGTG